MVLRELAEGRSDAQAQQRRAMITFHVPLRPAGKARPRFSRIRKGKRAGQVMTYTPKGTAAMERAIGYIASRAMAGLAPLRCAVAVLIDAHVEPDGNGWPVGKPDADNIAKLVLDACNKIVWTDDQVAPVVMVVKRFHAVEGFSVSVFPLSDGVAPFMAAAAASLSSS
jgi:Holliday junction resolvase RusA-like endonuclease